jgi:hypothetical protein
VRRTLEAGDGERTETVQLAPVSRFEGVWRMASGELRALAREGERVDVFKVDAVAGPRRFFRHYAFVPADRGIAFANDEEMVDQRAPDDPSCHLAVHVEYRYDADADALALRRDLVKIDFVDGHCVVRSHEPETTALVRVDQPHDTNVLAPPAGLPAQKPRAVTKTLKKQPKVLPLDVAKSRPFDAPGKAPPSQFTNTKQQAVDNIYQGDSQQAANAPGPQVNAPVQVPPQAPQQAPDIKRQKK